MVIHNLHLVRMTALPPKADAPLVVDSDAMLALPASFKELKPVARRHRHLPQFGGRVQGEELPSRAPLNPRREPAGEFRSKQPLGLHTRKAQNHWPMLTHRVNNVKRHIRSARQWPVSMQRLHFTKRQGVAANGGRRRNPPRQAQLLFLLPVGIK